MKMTANKSDLIRLSKSTGFQFGAIIEFQRLGLIARDLSKVSVNDPFLVRMKMIWKNRLLMKAQLAGLSSRDLKELIGSKEEVGEVWEDDAMDAFVELYRAGEEVTIGKVMNSLLYADAITPGVRKIAGRIRRAARERVRRERK